MFFMKFMTDSSGTDGLEYLIYRLFTIFLSNSVKKFVLCELVRLAEPIEPTEPTRCRLTAHLLPLRCLQLCVVAPWASLAAATPFAGRKPAMIRYFLVPVCLSYRFTHEVHT